MEKLSKSLEVLKSLSTSTNENSAVNNEKSRLDPVSISREKLHQINQITELISSPTLLKGPNENFYKLLTTTFETFFLFCDETDHDVRLAVEENLNKLVKNFRENQLTRVQVEIHRIIKRNPKVGPRALRGALWRFAELVQVIHPKKIRVFYEHLQVAFQTIAQRPEELIHEKLADYYELIFRVFGPSINDKEVKTLFLSYLDNLSNESALIRRSSAACLIVICRHCRYPLNNARFLMSFAIDQLVEHFHENESVRLISGFLGLIKNLVQFLGTNLEELNSNGTNVSSTNVNKNLEEKEQSLPMTRRNLIESVDIVCYLCLSHSDHNVVSTSLETLEILLKYSNLFELDRIFISTNSTDSAEETRVSQHLKTAIPNYQRSFIDPQDEQQLVNPSPIHEQSDWDSAITRPKRTSAAKLIEQLISKYILNSDGTIITDDRCRISIKCATLACLAYLSTLDPFAFFDSFDYPSEIITYLLSLRDHQDTHLRAACSNLLAKLTQTTVRLLNISAPISSLSSSFPNQNSLMSTDSQESSRLDLQLGILAEVLSTFRSCLNDRNSRVIHISLSALRTLLPILFQNSHALTIIGLELLEDAVQHTTNSYALTKVALAQLIGEIDFRVLTYLEQQQQRKRTNRSWLDRCLDVTFSLLIDEDFRVRQAAATTFAKFVDKSSFLPSQWPIHSLFKSINDSYQWIYEIHRTIQPINPVSIVSRVESQSEAISCLSSLIFERLAQASTRTQIVGCFEGILALTNVLTPKTVRAFFHNQFDELRLLIHFFKHPFILHDLTNLQLLMEILQRLFTNLQDFSPESLDVQSTEKVFHFLVKLLSIFCCIVDETSPPAPTTPKITFPPIPSSPQQLKKRFETTKDESTKNEKETSMNESKDSLNTSTSDKEKKTNRIQLGAFGNNSSMMKLFDLIRTSYQSWKTLISSTENDRFGQLLSTTLLCLASIVELISLQDLLRHLDETLTYLKSTFNVEKILTIRCTQQLVKCLHQLTSQSTNSSLTKFSTTSNNSLMNLHRIAIRQPMIYLFNCRNSSTLNNEQPIENTSIQELFLTKNQRKTIEYVKHAPNRTERVKIGNFIRLFESLVVLGLKKYVNSNEIHFQSSVLDLLVQLLLLRVNYGLLDADDHFLNNVISQLETIEETTIGLNVSADFISHVAEFLVLLSNENVHSKQVVKIQDMIKHSDLLLAGGHQPELFALSALEPLVYDLFLIRLKTDNKDIEAQRMVIVQTLLKLIRHEKALRLLIVIVDSVRQESDKWKRLSRQIVDVILQNLQTNLTFSSSQNRILLNFYSTQLTLFDIVSPVALRPIDPFLVAFRTLANRTDSTTNISMTRLLMNLNLILRCLIYNSTEDTLLTRSKDSTSIREENFSTSLIRVLNDVVQHILNETRRSRGEIDEILVILTSDYLYLLMHIVENAKQFRTIVHDLRQLLIHDEHDETVHRLDSFSYLSSLSEQLKLLSTFSIGLLLQWTHFLNLLDYTQESWWSTMLSIPTPSSLTTHLTLTGQLQSYCDLICRHELYVEHLISILTHRHLLLILFEQSDTCTYVHNLFGLIHRTPIASHLFVESIYTNWDFLFKRNQLLLGLKILRSLEGIHLDESAFLLVLLIEQFLTLPYSAILRLAELIICRRIEMMLTLDEQVLTSQLLPKYLPLLVQSFQSRDNDRSNEHLWALLHRLISKVNYSNENFLEPRAKTIDFSFNNQDEDFILQWIRQIRCPTDITPRIYGQMLKNVSYKKLLPFMMSPDFVWLSMPHCLDLGQKITSLWRASTSALVKKINDLCFSLPTQRFFSDKIDLHEDDSTPESIYVKSLWNFGEKQTSLDSLLDSISIYFEIIENNKDLTYQYSTSDVVDILRLIIFAAEFIFIKIFSKNSFLSLTNLESFLRCLNKTIRQPTSNIYQILSGSDQILSSCTLAKTLRTIYEFVYQRHAVVLPSRRFESKIDSFLNLIEPDQRSITQTLLKTFDDLDVLFDFVKHLKFISPFYRSTLRLATISIFRLPIFNSFIRIPSQFWEQNVHEETKKLKFSTQNFTLSSFPTEILQHSDIMADYIERISLVGWLSRTQFQEIWVTFLAAINSSNNTSNDDEQNSIEISKEEILETNATQCVWVRGVTTFLLNALRLDSTGNPADSKFEHRSRNKTIPFVLSDSGNRYVEIRSIFESNTEEISTNLERLATKDSLSYGQLSFETILASIQSNSAAPLPANSLFDRLFSRHGLDLTSSLQILIELYVRWLTNNPTNLCLQLKFELIRSFIYLSDLFTSNQQLSSLYDLCDDYVRNWFDEDDLLMPLITYGFCKCGILLGQFNKDVNELYLRLIERNFKYVSKTNAYACCLLFLESNEEDLCKSISNIFISEIQNEISTNSFKINLDIRINGLLLANIFYYLENFSTNSNIEQFALIFKDEIFEMNDVLSQHLISRAFERLLLLNQYPKNDLWRLYKRSKSILRQSIWINTDHLILIFAHVYTTLALSNENSSQTNVEQGNEDMEMLDSSSPMSSSDMILIELIGEFYERIKQSYTLPYEAIVLLRSLPKLFVHHGISERIMNKIVAEFASSPQQLYPQILAYTMFAVFRGLIQAHHTNKVNEWTLLSISSVAQRKPIRMAIWGLTCFMLSACPSHSIANTLFPLALSRFSARFEDLDHRLFLLAGREYYRQLNNVEQRRQFEQAFTNESSNETIYQDLLTHLRDSISSSSS